MIRFLITEEGTLLTTSYRKTSNKRRASNKRRPLINAGGTRQWHSDLDIQVIAL